jgi:hypothetical protein
MSPFEHGEVYVLDDGGEVKTYIYFSILRMQITSLFLGFWCLVDIHSDMPLTIF